MKFLLIRIIPLVALILSQPVSGCVFLASTKVNVVDNSEFLFAVAKTRNKILLLGPDSYFLFQDNVYLVLEEKPVGHIFLFNKIHDQYKVDKISYKIHKVCHKGSYVTLFENLKNKLKLLKKEISDKNQQLQKEVSHLENLEDLNFLVNLRIINSYLEILDLLFKWRIQWMNYVKNEVSNINYEIKQPYYPSSTSNENQEIRSILYSFIRAINPSNLEAIKKAMYILSNEAKK